MTSNNQELYISEAPQDMVKNGVIIRTMHYSAIYQASPLCASTPDRSIAEKVAYKAAEQLRRDVWTWYGQAGSFSSVPEYVHGAPIVR